MEKHSPARSTIQLDYVDGLRALAALYIVAHHALQSAPEPIPLLYRPFGFGQEVVAIFITLSGFCLALPQARRNVWAVDSKRFYSRRAWRILPPYYAAVAVGIVFALFRLAVGVPIESRVVWTHLLMIQNWSRIYEFTLIGPLWSVAAECQIYLLFPLFVMVRRKWGVTSLLLSGVIIGQGLFYLLHGSGRTNLIIYFAVGIACAEWAFIKRPRIGLYCLLAGASGVTLAWVAGAHSARVSYMACCLMSGALLVYLAHVPEKHPLRAALSWSPLVWVGLFSYSIYLIHGAFIEYARTMLELHGLGAWWGAIPVTVAAALISLPASYVFHVFLERPFMSGKRQTLEARQEVLVAGSILDSGNVPTQVAS